MENGLNESSAGFPLDENLDIKRYISLFLSNWYWFAVTLLISLAIAYGINRYSEPTYVVSATLLIKDDQMVRSTSASESVIPGGDIFKSQQNLKNEIGILKSLSLNDLVMKTLKEFRVSYVSIGRRGIVEKRLYKKCPFQVIPDSTFAQSTGKLIVEILSDSTYYIYPQGDEQHKDKKSVGEEYSKNGFKFIIVPRRPDGRMKESNTSDKYYFYFVNPSDLANQYRSKLSVSPIDKEASIVTLSVTGFDSHQETDYLNRLMDIYLKYGLDYKIKTAEQTIEFINGQIDTISASLSIAEAAMEKFRRDKGFLSLTTEGTILQNRLERLDVEKSTFEIQLQYYHYLTEYLESKNNQTAMISPSISGITDELLVKLVDEYSNLQQQREKLVFNIADNQKSIDLFDKQILKVREALTENIKNGENNIQVLIGNIDKKISVEKASLNNLPSLDREFITIQRGYDLNNTVYTYLLEKRAESGIAKASKIPDNRIIDYASPYSSGQIKPKTKQNLMLALIIGLVIPMVAIFLIDYMNDKVIDRRDVEKKTRVPILGYISHSGAYGDIPVLSKPRSSLAESFRSVRTSLKYFVTENKVQVIAVSSTISAEGKTFVSLNLAAITASLGKKVLLIGLDLRRPGINKVFSEENGNGMSTYLSNNCKYEDVIKKTHIDNLYFAPSGPIPPNPAELIDNEGMKIFIEQAKKEFDHIIIDTPPVAIVTDALLLSEIADVNVFIVRQRYTFRSTLDMIEQLRLQGELKNMCIIINDINLSGYYGYGMRYGYTLGFGYSYGYNYYNQGYKGRYGYSSKSAGYYNDEKD